MKPKANGKNLQLNFVNGKLEHILD